MDVAKVFRNALTVALAAFSLQGIAVPGDDNSKESQKLKAGKEESKKADLLDEVSYYLGLSEGLFKMDHGEIADESSTGNHVGPPP